MTIKLNFDLKKLDENITIYERAFLRVPYLFMNEQMIRILEAEAPTPSIDKSGTLTFKKRSDVIGLYNGIKVFLDNDLKFGEVEIR